MDRRRPGPPARGSRGGGGRGAGRGESGDGHHAGRPGRCAGRRAAAGPGRQDHPRLDRPASRRGVRTGRDTALRRRLTVPILIGLVLLAAIVVLPGWWVKRVMKRYHEPADRYPGTGAELARDLLDRLGLESVPVERTDQ